jgi:hypothetical protein
VFGFVMLEVHSEVFVDGMISVFFSLGVCSVTSVSTT